MEGIASEASTFFTDELAYTETPRRRMLIRLFATPREGRSLRLGRWCWWTESAAIPCSCKMLLAQWNGNQEAVNRLWIGFSSRLRNVADGLGMTLERWAEVEGVTIDLACFFRREGGRVCPLLHTRATKDPGRCDRDRGDCEARGV